MLNSRISFFLFDLIVELFVCHFLLKNIADQLIIGQVIGKKKNLQ